MSEVTTSEPPAASAKGRGFAAAVTLPNGQKKEIPWGFSDPRKEGKAAKAAGIEYPGTSRGN